MSKMMNIVNERKAVSAKAQLLIYYKVHGFFPLIFEIPFYVLDLVRKTNTHGCIFRLVNLLSAFFLIVE